MKIFIMTEPMDMSISIKIEKDDGTWIILKGQRDDQHMPAFGTHLDIGSQERLIQWLNKQPTEYPSQVKV